MKYLKLIFEQAGVMTVFRLAFFLILLYFVYDEAGPYTATAFLFCIASIELICWWIIKNEREK